MTEQAPMRSQYESACRCLGLPPTTSSAALVVAHEYLRPDHTDKQDPVVHKAVIAILRFHLAQHQQDQARIAPPAQ